MSSIWAKLSVIFLVGFLTIQFYLRTISSSTSDPSLPIVTPTTKDTIFTQILHRHGARTPMKLYENDPNKDFPEWRDLGAQQLTNLGKNQLFELGKFLRSRYSQLIPEEYSKDDIYVYSSDVDRTLMSAECELAGLYPPKGVQVWNENFSNWQPIPIHSRREEDDNIIRYTKPCTQYDYEYDKLLKTDEFREIYKQYFVLLEHLLENIKNTGKTPPIMDDMQYLNDVLKTELENNMKFPEWVTNETQRQLMNMSLILMQAQTWNDKLKRLKVGVFLQELVDHLVNKTEGKLEQKAWIYSAHDLTMLNVMQTLDIIEPHYIPAAAALMLELRKINGHFWVSIYYRNSTKVEPFLLHLPKCDDICELTRFIDIIKPYTLTSDQWDKECKLNLMQNIF